MSPTVFTVTIDTRSGTRLEYRITPNETPNGMRYDLLDCTGKVLFSSFTRFNESVALEVLMHRELAYREGIERGRAALAEDLRDLLELP